MIKDYYSLTKPGIIYGNAITVVAGFMLASKGAPDWWLLFATLMGLSLVVASGCVFNNYIDRDIDAKMERTKSRALVTGHVSLGGALIFGFVLGQLGLLILAIFTNLLTVLVSLCGLFVYVVVYSMWQKRASVYGTLVGSISGSIPPVVGYLAVTSSIDTGAIILFFILTLWQMPHSYAIAIYRLSDYARAGIPVLPVKKGISKTKFHMLAYIVLFIFATVELYMFGYVGKIYFYTMLFLGAGWLALGVRGLTVKNETQWARAMFVYSIVLIIFFCIVVAIDGAR